uniref:Uncharacterized protein n=1 Tax=Arundo donax TaxID=35708 RepID=A0A0A9DD40_ARUDO
MVWLNLDPSSRRVSPCCIIVRDACGLFVRSSFVFHQVFKRRWSLCSDVRSMYQFQRHSFCHSICFSLICYKRFFYNSWKFINSSPKHNLGAFQEREISKNIILGPYGMIHHFTVSIYRIIS